MVLVHDVALLAEWGRAKEFDLVIVVDVPAETQLERLTGQRGMAEDQARARMAAQASREQRLAVADIVIDNSGSRAGPGPASGRGLGASCGPARPGVNGPIAAVGPPVGGGGNDAAPPSGVNRAAGQRRVVPG